MDEMSEIMEMIRHQQRQISQLSQDCAALLQSSPGSRKGSLLCWRCHQPGHLARNCDGERVPAGARPSPMAKPKGNVQSSPRLATGAPAYNRPGSCNSGGGLRDLPSQPNPTPAIVLHCMCVCVCACAMVLISLLCLF